MRFESDHAKCNSHKDLREYILWPIMVYKSFTQTASLYMSLLDFTFVVRKPLYMELLRVKSPPNISESQ